MVRWCLNRKVLMNGGYQQGTNSAHSLTNRKKELGNKSYRWAKLMKSPVKLQCPDGNGQRRTRVDPARGLCTGPSPSRLSDPGSISAVIPRLAAMHIASGDGMAGVRRQSPTRHGEHAAGCCLVMSSDELLVPNQRQMDNGRLQKAHVGATL